MKLKFLNIIIILINIVIIQILRGLSRNQVYQEIFRHYAYVILIKQLSTRNLEFRSFHLDENILE